MSIINSPVDWAKRLTNYMFQGMGIERERLFLAYLVTGKGG
jgi:hypothetical protein